MISRTWNKGDLKVSGDRKYKFKFSGVATEAIALFSEQNTPSPFFPPTTTNHHVREDMCHGIAYLANRLLYLLDSWQPDTGPFKAYRT